MRLCQETFRWVAGARLRYCSPGITDGERRRRNPVTQRTETRVPASTLCVWRLASRDYDGGSPRPANIVITLVALGDRATAHAHRLTRHAETWLTTRFTLDRDEFGEPLIVADVGRFLNEADLVFLISDKSVHLHTSLTDSILRESSDKCLHLDLERTAAELQQTNSGSGKRPMISLGTEFCVYDENGSNTALSGVIEALLIGLFRHGIVGVDCADYLDAFSAGPWYAYAGFGSASGVKRSTVACDKAIAALEKQEVDISRSDIGVVVVALPEDKGTLSEFEHVVSIFQGRAPRATKLVAAPVGAPGSVEVALIIAQTPGAGHIHNNHEVHE